MEMLKGVLITFDMILMMAFLGMAVYSVTKAKKKDAAAAVVCGIIGAIIALNEAFIFLA